MLFKKFDKDNNKIIDPKEFKEIANYFIYKKELEDIFLTYIDNKIINKQFLQENEYKLMNIVNLQNFFEKEQNEILQLEEIKKIIFYFTGNKNEEEISFHTFSMILFTREFNSIFDKKKKLIYQVSLI